MSEEVVDAEVVEEVVKDDDLPERQDLKVAVIGNGNALCRATASAFNVPKGVEVTTHSEDDIDAVIKNKPNVVFWCSDIAIKKNDTLDDGDFINAIQKLIRISGSGICIRSTINIETYERLLMALTRQVFDNKIVYMPDLSDSENVQDIINAPLQIVGGNGKGLEQHMGVLREMSWFNAGRVQTGSIAEVVYVRLGVSGYRMVRQKYFDELHEAIMDMKNANPMVVNRMVQSALGEGVTPNFVTESERYDARIFAGATDTLTLVENCLS